MAESTPGFEKAMKLAMVSGMRCMLGPALWAASRGRPERKNLALAAMAELLADKLPMMPSRASFPLLIPRALAGAYVAKKVMEEEGDHTDSWTPALGAVLAIGVATIAPVLRGAAHHMLGVPDAFLGLAEDYLALKLGAQATGLTTDELVQLASESAGDVKTAMLPAPHSAGAGSM